MGKGRSGLIWVNNDCDRWHTVDITDSEQDDLETNDSSLASWQQVPDCQYKDAINVYAIPCTRDLEDYARLWIPGLSNLMQELPPNYGVTLQWRNNTGAGIRAFVAAEEDGGTNYLFNGTIASNQVEEAKYTCIGYVTSNQTISINNAFTNSPYGTVEPGEHYIFCGTAEGNDELVLQVTNQYGGVVGEASVFLNLKDIKEMYERWTVGDTPGIAPNNIAVIATNDLPPGDAPFQYSYNASVDSETPYILLVHGFNLPVWKKDRLLAETAYKRLYWQGYQGRFGLFRWPCDNSVLSFDTDEWASWQSGTGLKNRLVALNIQYPGNVYLLAHSLGNVAAGEALRQAGASEIVNTYVASQAALSAHAYDNTIPRDATNYYTLGTPDSEGHYYANTSPPYFNGISGAVNFIDFYNPVDWALMGSTILQPGWIYDQQHKPDISYYYQTPTTNDPSGYYQQLGLIQLPLSFTNNTYQIFSVCAQSYSLALGAETNIAGAFSLKVPINLNVAPYDFGNAHKGHSGQFRSDNMTRWVYWQQLLQSFGLNSAPENQ
jgi:hypothetical protein